MKGIISEFVLGKQDRLFIFGLWTRPKRGAQSRRRHGLAELGRSWSKEVKHVRNETKTQHNNSLILFAFDLV